MTKEFFSSFSRPEARYRGKPFWSWNGELDKDELLRQIHVLKEMGMGGYFMHSRTGLITEYLSDEWFELINTCADEGYKIGMESWLYDEDRWPSGTVGGEVSKIPEYRMKFIEMQVMDRSDFVWDDTMLAAFAVELSMPNFTSPKRLTNITSLEDCEVDTVLKFIITEMNPSSFYNGSTYIDTMNKEATEHFIDLTHEKYKEHCGDRLGKSIKGIFTDEPHRGPVMSGFSISNENKTYLSPWTYSLFEDFEKAFGYDLINYLPDLFLRKDGEQLSRVKADYIEILERLFIDNFAKPCKQWCEDNQLILTGHILHEDNLTAQTALSGSMIRYYEHMTYPGIDVLTESNNNYWVAKQVQSTKRQLGKTGIISELYGCSGWQMDFEDHKEVGDWQALFGVNIRCHHLSWYTMEGEAKRDYPASIFHQSYWYKQYSYVEDYFSRIHVFLEKGSPECNLLVVHPVESIWAGVYVGWANQLELQDETMAVVEEKFQKLFHILSGNKIDFDYGDEGVMADACKVTVEKGKAYIYVGQAKYEKVLVAGLATIRASTLDILTRFIDVGGEVIFTDDIPDYVGAVKSNKAIQVAEMAKVVAFNEPSIIEGVGDNNKVKVKDQYGKNIKSVFAHVRRDETNTYIMLLNVDRENDYKDASINLDYEGYLNVADARSGEIRLVESYQDRHEISLDLYKSMELMYIISNEALGQKEETGEELINSEMLLDDKYSYTLTEDNVCVLDFVEIKIDGRPLDGCFEVVKADQQIRDYFDIPHRSGEMVQPWFSIKEGDSRKLGIVELTYEFYIESIKDDVVLVLERPELFDVTVNESSIARQDDYDKWIDICFSKVRIKKEQLNHGKNVIRLTTEFHENTNVEAIYLLGDFGVEITENNKKTLVDLPEKLSLSHIEEQKLPFYGASIKYHIPVEIAKGQKARFSAESYDCGCFNVNGSTVAFKPYSETFCGDLELEVILTRRNTFGPLHQVTLYSQGYGPDNFNTVGDDYCDGYSLLPMGLNGVNKVLFLE